MIRKTEVRSLITQLLKSFLSLSFKYTGTALIDTPSAVMPSFTNRKTSRKRFVVERKIRIYVFFFDRIHQKHWKNIQMKTTAWKLNIGLTL